VQLLNDMSRRLLSHLVRNGAVFAFPNLLVALVFVYHLRPRSELK
jgi:hypothetical protein